jgi:hypothetical protein
MGCCGSKREQLLQQTRELRSQTVTSQEPVHSNDPVQIFEYTGRHALKLFGAISGRPDHFTYTGERVEVVHEDSFAMMAEKDVHPVPRRTER